MMHKNAFIFIIVLFSLIFVLAPIFYSILAVFLENGQIRGGLDLFDVWSGSFLQAAENYKTLAGQGALIAALVRTLIVALVVSTATALAALMAAYWISRVRFAGSSAIRIFAHAAYLTPPVVLVIALGVIDQATQEAVHPLVTLVIGHVVFLFPLAYVSALGHWDQGGFEIDRSAACDGAKFFERFWVHFGWNSPTGAFAVGLILLVFMLSWSDVVFSRFLLLGEPDARLLTDLVLDFLGSNEEVEPRAQIAALSTITLLVAAVAAYLYGVVFTRSQRDS